MPPRLAHMVMAAAELGAARDAANIAAVLVERGLGGTSPDLDLRLETFRRDRSPRAQTMKRLATDWARSAEKAVGSPSTGNGLKACTSTAALLALAFPDRIARSRGSNGDYLLASGRGARLDSAQPLSRERNLVVAELSGTATASRILSAVRLDETELRAIAGDRIDTREELSFDPAARALRARSLRRLGAIVLESEPRAVSRDFETAAVLADAIAEIGITELPWTPAQMQLRDRVAFLRATSELESQRWPDLGDAALAGNARNWLAPFVIGATRLADVTSDMLDQALLFLLPYSEQRQLERTAPTHFEAPTGHRHRIDYKGEGAPIVAIRVQELFGLTTHPAIAGGRLPLTLHLLSPAQRPIQITRDLPRFWSGSWRDVKAEMKGRYPKHPWPDDPATALPTTRAKPRS